MGSNVWANFIVVDFYFVVRVLPHFINPVLEYGCIVYSSATPTHLNRLDQFQTQV